MKKKKTPPSTVMPEELQELMMNQWTTQANGDYTFFGVLYEHFEVVARRWTADATRKNYVRDYDRYLLAELEGKPLPDYTVDDFDAVINSVPDKLRADDRVVNAERIQHFRILIRAVTRAAEELGICEDVLWGSRYQVRSYQQDSDETIKKRHRRSFTEEEEVIIFHEIMQDEQQSGQKIGLAIMFDAGTRNNEACAVLYGDLKELKTHPGCYYLRIYKSTVGETNNQKLGGKTQNMVRYILISDKLAQLILRRRAYLKELIMADRIPNLTVDISDPESIDAFIDRLPIANLDNIFTEGCKTTDLTKAATHLFHKVLNLDEGMIVQINDELQDIQESESFTSTNSFRNIEKDPTAYLFRRNFGTRMYHLGLSEAEVEYVIGHDIETELDTRAGFRNEEKLYPIYQKVHRRYILNSTDPEELQMQDSYAVRQNTTDLNLAIPLNRVLPSVRIQIASNEADSHLQIRANTHGGTANIKIKQRPNIHPLRDEVNISEFSGNRYNLAVEGYRKKFEEKNEERISAAGEGEGLQDANNESPHSQNEMMTSEMPDW